MAKRDGWIVIGDLRGGRNDTDPPLSLPDTQCVEALNVDWYQGTLANKRGGSTGVTDSGGTAFSSGIQSLVRHVPGADETAAEFWGVDGAATPIVKRMTGGTSFANVTLDDAISTKPQEVEAATLNGKLFLAYDSTVDRLHVYDPNLSSPRVRRVGFATPAAPTAADNGVGAYPATLRYYRVRWLQMNGTTIVRRSEGGASLSFTPSGAGTQVIVTRPAAAGEGETHWEVEVSTDNATWYVFVGVLRSSPIAIATTTQNDSGLTSAYGGYPVSDAAGFYSRFPSVKHLLTDGNRLLGAGAWESSGADSGGKNSRVWFTPVLGSADKGDDERVPNQTNQKNWLDLNENDGGGITALMGPLNGVVLAAKYRQLHRLIPTGDVFAPYLPRKVSEWVGVVGGKAWCVGRDDAGQPCVYFLSAYGPYRYGAGGLQYMGRDNETTWATLSLGATGVVAWVLYHPDKHQVWWHIAVSSGNDPSLRMVFDVLLGRVTEHNEVRGGWAKHTGDAPTARCGCLFANTLGASMSRDLKPYIGRASGTAIQKADTTDTSDNGTAFQAYVTPKPIRADAGSKVGIRPPTLVAKAVSVTNIALTLIRDYGLETPNASSVSLAPTGSETRVVRKFEAMLSGADVIQPQVGDAVAVATAWTLDELSFPIDRQEIR